MMLRYAIISSLLMGALASPVALRAQVPEQGGISPGKPETGKFTRPIFGDQHHIWLFSDRVEQGTTLHATARWITKPHPSATLIVVMSDPGSSKPAPTHSVVAADGNSVTAYRTSTTAGAVFIYVMTNAPGFTGTYELTVGPRAPAAVSEERSQTDGFHFAGGWNTTTFKSQFSTETGQGQGGRIGLGFGPLLLYGELQQSEMENESGDPADAYTLTQRELGARLYLLGKGSRIRPFAQYAYGFRRLESVETPVQGEGIATTPGAGVALYLMKRLSVEGAWTRTTGDVDRARASSDDDWSDLPEEFVIRGPGTRISVQMVLHL